MTFRVSAANRVSLLVVNDEDLDVFIRFQRTFVGPKSVYITMGMMVVIMMIMIIIMIIIIMMAIMMMAMMLCGMVVAVLRMVVVMRVMMALMVMLMNTMIMIIMITITIRSMSWRVVVMSCSAGIVLLGPVVVDVDDDVLIFLGKVVELECVSSMRQQSTHSPCAR